MNRRYVLIGLIAGLAAAAWLLSDNLAAVRKVGLRAEHMRMFQSSDPEERKRAAWSVIENRDTQLEAFMSRQLLGRELSADVRESYVYSLGKLCDAGVFPAIETALDSDQSGYVRAAAWLAAARSDADRFRALAAGRLEKDAWDIIGVAQGRLALGDVSGVGDLLRFARDADEQIRYVASRALYRWLRPLLDAAGRWPIDACVGEGEAWPPGLVEVAALRCARLDLQALADDTRRHDDAAGRVRRNQARITKAREDLVDLLFAQ